MYQVKHALLCPNVDIADLQNESLFTSLSTTLQNLALFFFFLITVEYSALSNEPSLPYSTFLSWIAFTHFSYSDIIYS